MSFKQISIYLIVVVLGLHFSSNDVFAQKKKKKSSSKKTEQKISGTELQLLKDIFLDATQAKLLGDTDKAKELYQDCLNLSPNNAAANYELALLYQDEKDNETALTYAENASKAAPKNKWYQYLFADLLLYNNQTIKAASVYENLIRQHPNDIDNYHKISYIYRIAGETDKAIDALDRLEGKTGVVEEISLDKQRLYLQKNDVDGAGKELEKLIENNPKELRFYNQLAELYLANRKEDQANEIYKRMIEVAPDNPLAQMAMARQYYSKGETAKANEMLMSAFAKPEIPAEQKISILMGMIGQQPSKETLKEAKSLGGVIAQTHPKNAQIQAIQGDIYIQLNEKENARDAFRRTVDIDANLYPVWEQVMFLEYDLGKYDDLLKTTKESTELFPNQPLPHYFKGLANYQLKDYDKAVRSLKRSAIIGSDNENLLIEVYSLIGDAYHSLKDHESSDNYYDKSLEIKPDNPLVLNNYAYYLSLRKEQLAKAEEMSKKSNELETNNSSYQDTYGWILYEQGKYEEAKVWLEKALSNGGDKRPVIVEHYGDVLFKLNKKAEAIEQWRKAIELGGNKKELDKKIAQ